MAALMERPWRWYAEASPMRIAVFGNKAERGQPGWSDFRRPTMAWPASVERPDSVFLGRLAILVDAGCHSACEDFAMPFADNGRALLLGEETAGSSGQPYYEDLGDGMRLMVGMKREFFPDGSRFEGVGILPDVRIVPTADDIRDGRDPELEAAVALVRTDESGAD
jgi:carboxyl-terminal processing protease